MSTNTKNTRVILAAENMDWGQVVMNGGPACFHVCEDGYFCGRAQRWDGHLRDGCIHPFVSLADLLREASEQRAERTRTSR